MRLGFKPIKCVACGRDKLGPIWNTSNVCRNCRQIAKRLFEHDFTVDEVFIVLNYGRLFREDE
jgi:hypothetical protein